MAIFPGTLLGPYEVVGPLGAGGPTCAERSLRSNIAAIYGIEDRAIVMELVEGVATAESATALLAGTGAGVFDHGLHPMARRSPSAVG